MVKVRRVILWTTMLGAANLAQLAALSAFIGEAKAWTLFNSVPLMLGWLTLTGLLIAGFTVFPRLLRNPGLLAIHLGCVLILLGGMLGSKAGMKVVDSFKEHKRIFKGSMQIYDGESRSDVADEREQQFDLLPFEVQSERCWIEYYPYEHKLSVQVTETVKTGRWESVKEHVGDHDGDHSGPDHDKYLKEVLREKEASTRKVKRFKWKPSKWRDLPLTDDIKIRVTGFRIQDPVTEPFLLLPSRDRHSPARKVPARIGQQFEIGSGHAGTLVGRIQGFGWVRWKPHPMQPGQIRLVPYDQPGGSPSAVIDVIDVSQPRGRTFIYTQKIADGLGTDALMAPARYIPQAETKKATGREQPGPVLVVPLPGHDKPDVVPTEVGRMFTFMPAGSHGRGLIGRIRRPCFVRLQSDPKSPEKREVVEAKASDPGAQPAVEVDLFEPSRTISAYAPGVTDRLRRMGQATSMVYIPADDPHKMTGMERPVITFEVKRGSNQAEETITINKGQASPAVSLESLYDSDAAWEKAGRPFVFAGDKPPIKEYYSHLVIRKDGKEVARKTIEVNHPMAYGGYHFYQTGFDEEDQSYTYISIKSDAGWSIALAGMVMLMLGTFVQFWFEPIWKARKKRRNGALDVTEVAVEKGAV